MIRKLKIWWIKRQLTREYIIYRDMLFEDSWGVASNIYISPRLSFQCGVVNKLIRKLNKLDPTLKEPLEELP